jgi:hypothetical protein
MTWLIVNVVGGAVFLCCLFVKQRKVQKCCAPVAPQERVEVEVEVELGQHFFCFGLHLHHGFILLLLLEYLYQKQVICIVTLHFWGDLGF